MGVVDVLYKAEKEGKIKCLACKRECIIKEGDTGVCGVRKNENGKLKLLVYENLNAVSVDPIEKKPLFHFLPGSNIFSLGTVGCNFFCDFCQNWQSSQLLRISRSKNPEEILSENSEYSSYKLAPKETVDFCVKNDIPSVAFTYNEPTIFAEYSHDVMKKAMVGGQRKLLGVYITNGYFTKPLLDYMDGHIDAMNIDLKAFSEGFYTKHCNAKFKEVLDGIEMAFKRGIWIELTTMLIPGENDNEKEIESVAKFISELSNNIPWHVTSFSPAYKMVDKPSTPIDSIKKAVDIGKDAGLKYVYGGNISDVDMQSTYCPKCNKLLIERSWASVNVLGLKDDECKYCGEKIPGIWNAESYLSEKNKDEKD